MIERARSASLQHSLTDAKQSYDELSADLAKTEEELDKINELRCMTDNDLDALFSELETDCVDEDTTTSATPQCPEA